MVTKPPSKRLELLTDRNTKLSAQTTVQREEIGRLQRRLEELEDKEQHHQENILCVNRLWEELNNSIAFLNFRASGTLDNASAQENTQAADIELLDEANPFLAKLVKTFLGGSHAATKPIVEDISDVEATLRKRMNSTMQAASRVLEAIETGRQIQEPTSPTGSKESQLAAINNLLRADNNRLRDQALQDSTKIRELQNSLADKDEELLVAQRKMVQLKEESTSQPIQTNQEETEQPKPDAAAVSTKEEENKAETLPSVDAEELKRLQKLIQRRESDVDARDVSLSKAEREIKDLRSKLQYEREGASRARQFDRERAQHLSDELDALDKRLQDSYRERDHLLGRLQGAQLAADSGASASRRLAISTAHINDLEAQVENMGSARIKAENELEKVKSTLGNQKTTQEFVELVSSLEHDLETARQTAHTYKAASEKVDRAEATAAEAVQSLEETQARLKIVRSRLDQARARLQQHGYEKMQWKEREEELRLFVEVSQHVLAQLNGNNQRNDEELKAQVDTFLQSQADTVQKTLRGVQEERIKAQAVADADAKESAARSATEALEEENAALSSRAASLQRRIADLETQAVALRAESDVFMKEMESVGEAYATARDQNARLLEKIASRDQDNAMLLSEAADATRERSAMVEERDMALGSLRRMHEAARAADDRIEELETKLKSLNEDLVAAKSEARRLGSRSDASARDLENAQAALAAATKDVESAKKESERIAEERNQESDVARKERTRAERAEQDAADLQARLVASTRTGGGGSGGGGGAAEEFDALRKMVNCNVCSTRLKDRIITKCNHIFCSHCIEANLSTRHRKCPGCGERFGLNDVKPFFFT